MHASAQPNSPSDGLRLTNSSATALTRRILPTAPLYVHEVSQPERGSRRWRNPPGETLHHQPPVRSSGPQRSRRTLPGGRATSRLARSPAVAYTAAVVSRWLLRPLALVTLVVVLGVPGLEHACALLCAAESGAVSAAHACHEPAEPDAPLLDGAAHCLHDSEVAAPSELTIVAGQVRSDLTGAARFVTLSTAGRTVGPTPHPPSRGGPLRPPTAPLILRI